MEPLKRGGNGQLNLNTVLLGICVTLSGWSLKSIVDLKEEIVAVRIKTDENSSTIMGINQVILDQSKTIEQLSIRLTTIETKESDSKNKN
jgi:uncharacterized coiled-coil protein SlyX